MKKLFGILIFCLLSNIGQSQIPGLTKLTAEGVVDSYSETVENSLVTKNEDDDNFSYSSGGIFPNKDSAQANSSVHTANASAQNASYASYDATYDVNNPATNNLFVYNAVYNQAIVNGTGITEAGSKGETYTKFTGRFKKQGQNNHGRFVFSNTYENLAGFGNPNFKCDVFIKCGNSYIFVFWLPSVKKYAVLGTLVQENGQLTFVQEYAPNNGVNSALAAYDFYILNDDVPIEITVDLDLTTQASTSPSVGVTNAEELMKTECHILFP